MQRRGFLQGLVAGVCGALAGAAVTKAVERAEFTPMECFPVRTMVDDEVWAMDIGTSPPTMYRWVRGEPVWPNGPRAMIWTPI